MEDAEIENWAESYIRYYDVSSDRNGEESDYWAVELFMTSEVEMSESHWKVINLIVNKSNEQSVIGNLAAGPLEDLIHYHGKQFIDRIETEARKNPLFRHLLGGVWNSGPSELWSRIEKARNYISW